MALPALPLPAAAVLTVAVTLAVLLAPAATSLTVVVS